MIEPWGIPTLAGVLGLVLGSFLNVCVFRWPNDESVVSPPSRCPSCGTGVRWFDNVPVLSWLLLRGRCRSCGAAISIQYPLVELTVGLIWAGVFWEHGLAFESLRGAVFLTILFGIALADARYYIIPDQFSLGGLGIGLALSLAPGGPDLLATESGLLTRSALVGAASGFLILWAVAFLGTRAFKKEAMGGGDIKMMAMVGAFLALPGVLLTIFLGALLGSVVFGPISWRTGKLVPFGIFLAAGAAISYAWGDAIVGWYLTSVVGIGPG